MNTEQNLLALEERCDGLHRLICESFSELWAIMAARGLVTPEESKRFHALAVHTVDQLLARDRDMAEDHVPE